MRERYMTKTLYHYVHCPFCVRVRLTAGLLKVPYKSVVVAYDDVETPTNLIGKKMLPIMDIEGKITPESLDIMLALDEKNILQLSEMRKSENFIELEKLLPKISNLVHPLVFPYWIYTPEFSLSARDYFQKQKEAKRGPFKDLVKNRSIFEKDIKEILFSLELRPFYKNEKFSAMDILLASHLWGLYVVPEFQFPDKIHHYLQSVKEICAFNYHEDFWK
jgi:glutaredoxin 2